MSCMLSCGTRPRSNWSTKLRELESPVCGMTLCLARGAMLAAPKAHRDPVGCTRMVAYELDHSDNHIQLQCLQSVSCLFITVSKNHREHSRPRSSSQSHNAPSPDRAVAPPMRPQLSSYKNPAGSRQHPRERQQMSYVCDTCMAYVSVYPAYPRWDR